MPNWPFSASRAKKDAEALFTQVRRASRDAALYGEGRAGDTLEGRFELMALYASLALIRLRQAPAVDALTQAFVDILFREIDSGLREDGVGDLAVPKRVHRLAGAFYGRAEAYAAALASDDEEKLASALSRNVLGGGDASFAETLAHHVRNVAAAQAASDWTALLTPVAWPAFPA